ncbi:MAG: family 10 glycosylhydrolase [Lachnospiraceae bacterium]|nr:family 10 glycosylhydrolase [Lachnospiraceae bacterium]
MKKKRIVSLFLTMLLVLASIMSPIALENQVKAATVVVKYGGKKHSFTAKKQTTAKVNGKKIKTPIPGLIVDGTNLVSVRVFKEKSLGVTYKYNSKKKIVTLKKDKTTIKITMGSKFAYVNGKKTTMPTKALRVYYEKKKKYYLMVPARFVAENLGFSYVWENGKRMCKITTINGENTATATPSVEQTVLPEVSNTPIVEQTVVPELTNTPIISPTITPTAIVSSTPNITPTPELIETPIVSTGSQITETPQITTNGGATMKPDNTEEMKAMWISYLEYGGAKKSKEEFTHMIDEMFTKSSEYGMNTVIVQVRPFSDAMYDSEYFPWSKYASGTIGTDPGYDPLEIMVDLAHKKNLKIQAWINPYRITADTTDESTLPGGHPAKKWMNSSSEGTQRRVLSYGGKLYYNPSKAAVRELIVNGVKEIVKNYDVDGIHFDDYFYPQLGSSYKKVFDANEYNSYVENCKEENVTASSIVSWRRGNVNKLVKQVYKAIKEIDPNVEFGISPAGNINNLLSSTAYYANVKKWMSSNDFVDYICPQIYWSFKNKTCPYAETVDDWLELKTSETVKLYIGIGVYRAGSNLESEWANSNTVLKRQIEYGRSKKGVSGFFFYRYASFQQSATKKEIKNLLPLLKNED